MERVQIWSWQEIVPKQKLKVTVYQSVCKNWGVSFFFVTININCDSWHISLQDIYMSHSVHYRERTVRVRLVILLPTRVMDTAAKYWYTPLAYYVANRRCGNYAKLWEIYLTNISVTRLETAQKKKAVNSLLAQESRKLRHIDWSTKDKRQISVTISFQNVFN
jgi:hypothetical protein